MSFLRRLVGGGDAQKINVNVTFFQRVRDDATLDLVGEAYRQEQVRAARPPDRMTYRRASLRHRPATTKPC